MRYGIYKLRYRTDDRWVLYGKVLQEIHGVTYWVTTRNLLVGTWQECINAVSAMEKNRAWE